MDHKRPLPVDESHYTPAKQLKPDHPDEFSNTVKKRLATSTRTGQACDRCKVRKIRCDGLPGGCSPCLQNNTECFTTDRITGRATSRGYTEELEQQVRELQHRNQDLEQRLRAVVLPHDSPHDLNEYQKGSKLGQAIHRSTWDAYPYSSQKREVGRLYLPHLPAASNLRATATVERYPTISYGNPSLISLRGTALSLLGMEFDVVDFSSEDLDEPCNKNIPHPHLYNKSYFSFIQTTHNVGAGVERPELPPRSEAVSYSEWYFKTVNPLLPLLHKPTTTRILNQMYDHPSLHPTAAQLVTVHMIFSIMLFRLSARSPDDGESAARLNHRSNMHYQYCLSFSYQLCKNCSFQDCQALTLICSHMRNFSKPCASWFMVEKTMSIGLELGLHRSPKLCQTDVPQTLLDVEMRKRVFWCILALHTHLSGKLGRPMRLRLGDVDCEIPEMIDDECLEEGINSPSTNCKHLIGIEAFKLVPLFIELYSVIYAVRRKQESYVSTICNLEARLRAWKESLPSKLTKVQEDLSFGLYTQMYYMEFRLLLRHPSVWTRDSDEAFNSESMRICVESSRQMLGVVRQLQKNKLLETSWCNTTIYALAIITTLYAQWENKIESTLADLAALKEEMDLWLDIIGEVGKLMGSGDRLREVIREITDKALDLMSRSLVPKASFASSKGRKNFENQPSPCYHPSSKSTCKLNSTHNQAYDFNILSQSDAVGKSSSSAEKKGSQVKSFKPPSKYSTCPENHSSSMAYSTQGSPHNFSTFGNNSEPTEGPPIATLAAPGPQAQQHGNPPSWHRSSPHSFGSQIWGTWNNRASESLEQPDCYGANALLQLGSRNLNNEGGIAQNSMGEIRPPDRQAAHLDQNSLGLGNIDAHGSSGVGTGNEWSLPHY